jgi:pimeloyl-ACP methyl ester carboxylesterase
MDGAGSSSSIRYNLRVKRKIGLLAAAALFLAATAVGVFLAFPFQGLVAYRQARLHLSGTSSVRLDGGLAAYEKNTCVAGKPCRCIALIHGLGDSALTWDGLLRDPRAAAEGQHFVAPNMPGSDGSPVPPDPSGWAIRAQAWTLRSALEPICPQWTVVANSLGGWTSLWMALDWPAGVHDLVLVDSAGIDDPSGRQEESARVLAEPTIPLLKTFRKRAHFAGREVPERVWRAVLASIVGRHTYELVHGLKREELLDARLGALRAPTAIIWGATDGIIPLDVGRRLHALIAGSTFETVPNCGHLPQVDCPEPVAKAVFGAPAAN